MRAAAAAAAAPGPFFKQCSGRRVRRAEPTFVRLRRSRCGRAAIPGHSQRSIGQLANLHVTYERVQAALSCKTTAYGMRYVRGKTVADAEGSLNMGGTT